MAVIDVGNIIIQFFKESFIDLLNFKYFKVSQVVSFTLKDLDNPVST